MVRKNDIYGYDLQLKRAIEKIRRSKELSKGNKAKILDFHRYCIAEGLGTPRIIKYLYHLYNIAAWLKKDFKKATKKDIEDLILKINKSDYTDNTKKDYKVSIKKFYKWLNGGDDYPDAVRWVKTGTKSNNNQLPDELLTENEVKKMIENCTHPRDKALISTLYESGCRVGELCMLTLKNVSFEKDWAQIIVNGKTGTRRIRLIASTPYLATWIDNHPLKDDLDAPLWVGIGTTNKNMPLDYPGLRKMLQEVAKRAGIKKSVNPHAFRHSRATYLANHLTEAQMNQIFGWVQGSDMPSTYVHLSGRDTDRALMRIYGLGEEEGKEESVLKPKKCSRCNHRNPATARYCNKCGAVLEIKTALELLNRREILENVVSMLMDDEKIHEILRNRIIELGDKSKRG